MKLRIGVLMGGMSIEREVSFNSGRTVCDHLDTHVYDIKPIFQHYDGTLYLLPWRFLHRGKISDFAHRLSEATIITWDELKEVIDFIYITTHGRYAEDGTLQGMLEVLGIPYLGSKVYASALCMNKITQKEVLKANGIDVPRGIVVAPHQLPSLSIEHILARLAHEHVTLPVVIRPEAEGSSLGVRVVFEEKDVLSAIMHAATIYPLKTQAVLVEEKLEGMEFCSIIITHPETGSLQPLPFTEILPEEGTYIFDYEQKYMPGRSIQYTPARCNIPTKEKIDQTCIKTMQVLDITNCARIDGFFTQDGRVVIIDPNTLTGMGPATFLFRQAAHSNMSHTELINHLIKTELTFYGLTSSSQLQTAYAGATMELETTKLRVAVLFGGRSNEKEISLESGRNIFYKLSPQKYSPLAIFVDKNLNLHIINQKLLVCHSTQEIEHDLAPSMRIPWSKLPQIADFVFIGLHGGEGENGCIQGTLEMLGLPYNGSGVLTSALCMNKFKTNEFLKQKGFDVPKNVFVSHLEWKTNQNAIIAKILEQLPPPLIVKPHDDGCSVMVQKVIKPEQLKNALDTIFVSGKTHVLVEECVTGTELTVGVVGNHDPQVLPPSQVVASKGILSIEEKFLPGTGENQTPALLPAPTLESIQHTIKEVFLALNCKGYARIDCFYQNSELSPTGKERLVIIEPNTLPGLTPATCLFHQAAEVGIKPMELIDTIVGYGLEEHTQAAAQLKDLMDHKESPCQKNS